MRQRGRTLEAYGFLLPALVLLSIFVLFPLVFGLLISFFHYNAVSAPRFAGFDNFKRILQDPVAMTALKNSLLYLLVVPVLQLGSILLAILLNHDMKGVRVFRMLFYVPVITSIVVVALGWKWVLAENGIANGALLALHLIRAPIHWLTDPSLALYSVMVVTMWKGLGYYMVIYLAGLQSVDPQYEEAAKLDGAGPLGVFRHITLPLLKPTIAFCAMISCIAAIKVFAEIYVMTEGGPLYSTTTMVVYIFDLFMNQLKLGYASALGVFLAVVIGLLSTLNYRFFRQGGFEAY